MKQILPISLIILLACYSGLKTSANLESAQHAAASMNEWLTRDFVDQLLGNNNRIGWHIEESKFNELEAEQKIILGKWKQYPQFITHVYAYYAGGEGFTQNFFGRGGNFEHYSEAAWQRNGKHLTDALIKFNFGEEFFEKVKQISAHKHLDACELYPVLLKATPYLMILQEKKSLMSDQEFEAEIKRCDDQLKISDPELGFIDWHNILFLLNNPYFFMTHVLTWSGQNHRFRNGEFSWTDEGNIIIELLLAFGFDVNCMLGTGCDSRDTLLHRAVRYEDVDMVKLLLEWGADPSICYHKEPDPEKRYNGGGQSPWELSIHKMRGETWITPNRPPSERTRAIHAMLKNASEFEIVHQPQ